MIRHAAALESALPIFIIGLCLPGKSFQGPDIGLKPKTFSFLQWFTSQSSEIISARDIRPQHERPAYSTPQPVENTPANNECRMVEFRGAKVASFFIGGDEFICLPQAFDLFLKHLVGGLHTVYTKLKRLSIAPVVCNVEQVRILRGLGAIQPGVNRCKLITRKDFEILYQDCSQASRPGRPPKRYPMLPPTSEFISHHARMRSMNPTHGILATNDFSSLHERMQLDQDPEIQLRQRQEVVNANDGPDKERSLLTGKSLSTAGLKSNMELHTNATSLYLQAQHALRQQYQQAATTSLHNSVATQQLAAAAGICPALTPLMLMSNPGFFSGGLPPTSVAMLNHINQVAQGHGNENPITTAAAAAAAQIAANGGSLHQRAAAAQAAYQVVAAAQSVTEGSEAPTSGHDSPPLNEHLQGDGPTQGKNSECIEVHALRGLPPMNHVSSSGLTTRLSSDGYTSPQSSVSSAHETEQVSNGSLSIRSGSVNSNKDITDLNEDSRPRWADITTADTDCITEDHDAENEQRGKYSFTNPDGILTSNAMPSLGDRVAISSMQTLLTNIQSLLKVAAENARLREKHTSFEIDDLKTKLNKEERLRSAMEKKYQDSERLRSQIEKRLQEEKGERKILQEQLSVLQRQLENDSSSQIGNIPTTPITGVLGCGRKRSKSVSPTRYPGKHRKIPSTTSSVETFCPGKTTCPMDAYCVPSSAFVSSPRRGELGTSTVNSRIRPNGHSNDCRNGAIVPQSNLMSSIGHHSPDQDQETASEIGTASEENRGASYVTDHHVLNT